MTKVATESARLSLIYGVLCVLEGGINKMGEGVL